jgi:hypothetical protein
MRFRPGAAITANAARLMLPFDVSKPIIDGRQRQARAYPLVETAVVVRSAKPVSCLLRAASDWDRPFFPLSVRNARARCRLPWAGRRHAGSTTAFAEFFCRVFLLS